MVVVTVLIWKMTTHAIVLSAIMEKIVKVSDSVHVHVALLFSEFIVK